VPPPPPPPPLLEEPPEAHDEATSHAPVTIIPIKRRADFRATCGCPESRKECRWRKIRAAITKFTYRHGPILGNIAAQRIIGQEKKVGRRAGFGRKPIRSGDDHGARTRLPVSLSLWLLDYALEIG
jgi:hypothetical protein